MHATIEISFSIRPDQQPLATCGTIYVGCDERAEWPLRCDGEEIFEVPGRPPIQTVARAGTPAIGFSPLVTPCGKLTAVEREILA